MKSSYTFKSECTEGGAILSKVELYTEALTLSEILEEFENFLKASGFSPKGHLEFVDYGDLDE